MDAVLVAQLRRMIVEPTEATYTSVDLWGMIEESSVRDSEGRAPGSNSWVATYNVFQVASDIWAEKAGALVMQHDFSADGGKFSRSQMHAHAIKMSQYYASKSKVTSIRILQEPILTGLNPDGYEDIPYKDDDVIYY